MPSLPCFNRRFTPSWTMALLAVLFFVLFLYLGFWQMKRAQEKENLLQQKKVSMQQPATPWQPHQSLPKPYQAVTLSGHYLPQVFFLDNQHHEHQFGYHIFSPFKVNDGGIILVDRGWVRGDPARRTLPEVHFPATSVNLKGNAYYPNTRGLILGPVLEKKDQDTYILEQINFEKLNQILQIKIYPFIIRLDKQQAHGFVREWAVVSMPPQRHLAYAFQWFSMALVILILFVALNLKEKI